MRHHGNFLLQPSAAHSFASSLNSVYSKSNPISSTTHGFSFVHNTDPHVDLVYQSHLGYSAPQAYTNHSFSNSHCVAYHSQHNNSSNNNSNNSDNFNLSHTNNNIGISHAGVNLENAMRHYI